MNRKKSIGYTLIAEYFKSNHQKPFPFQEMTWDAINNGESGLVNAPTGMGKTFAIFLGALIQFIDQHPTRMNFIQNATTDCNYFG